MFWLQAQADAWLKTAAKIEGDKDISLLLGVQLVLETLQQGLVLVTALYVIRVTHCLYTQITTELSVTCSLVPEGSSEQVSLTMPITRSAHGV